MVMWALLGVASAFAVYDVYLSNRRLRKYGVGAELNPLTGLLCREVGILNGVLMGVLVPHLTFSYAALAYDWQLAYAFYTGWLAKQFIMQLASLSVEREFDEIRARVAASSPSPEKASPSSSEKKDE